MGLGMICRNNAIFAAVIAFHVVVNVDDAVVTALKSAKVRLRLRPLGLFAQYLQRPDDGMTEASEPWPVDHLRGQEHVLEVGGRVVGVIPARRIAAKVWNGRGGRIFVTQQRQIWQQRGRDIGRAKSTR